MIKILELNYWLHSTKTEYYFNVLNNNEFEILYLNKRSSGFVVFSKYEKVTLQGLENSGVALNVYNTIADNAELVWLEAPSKQRATFLRNLIIYAQSRLNKIPLYRIVKDIKIVVNDKEECRSINSVVKNIYANKFYYNEVLRKVLENERNCKGCIKISL